MTKKLHPDSKSLSYPDHGGNPREVADLAGVNPESILDFSASINPLGPPTCVSQLLLETPHLLNEYPDTEAKSLKKIIARQENVTEDWIRVTNGSTEFIYLLPFLFSQDQELLIVNPFFSEYEKSFSRFGFKIHPHTLSPENQFQIQVPELIQQLETIGNLGGIILGHPNSPTGNLQTHALEKLIEYCNDRDATLFIDETFIDFVSSKISIWDKHRKNPNLVLIKSLTKFYSLPGLRIGYGILSPENNEKMALHQNPWSVNALAQFIGSEVLIDKSFQDNSRTWLKGEKLFLLKELNMFEEIEIFSSEANFILFRLKNHNAGMANDFFNHLLLDGILLRNCGNFTGLNESFFRASVRFRKDNQKLLNSVQYFFNKIKK
ncbi:MAG: aminotransferase class I/II-fold pyridoxal phosphate-dependent enzyme [Nitrospinae bacterium]|nr:aminotransferase class I/II-fold pyridoxal phosphate-dependent enzyme [Nitrospinota bacterium]